MSVWILNGVVNAENEQACLVDSVNGTAFGTLFDSFDHADDFCRWCADRGDDPREIWAAGDTAWQDALAQFAAAERENRRGDDDYERAAEAHL